MIWKKFIEIGTSDKHPEENDMIKLYNGMALFCCIASFFMVLGSIHFKIGNVYSVASSVIPSFYFAIFFLNGLGLYKISRLLLCIGSPFWVCGCSLVFAGFFSQGAAIISTMAITSVTFKNNYQLRNRFLVFQALCFTITFTFLSFYGPIVKLINAPFDEVLVFWGSIGWAVILIYNYEAERTKMLKDLQQNVTELEETTEELEKFTYIASHDLKSPLRIILSFIGLIEKDLENKKYDTLDKKVEFVKTGAMQMHFLVEDILELSLLKEQTKSGRINMDLNEILSKAKINLSEEIESRKVNINASLLPSYLGTELEFLLLFQNLIQNGIKYNRSLNPTINISSELTKDNLRLKFQDNGIGIDEENHKLIFEFFKRLHNTDEFKGTGLGLGLCKRIINSYDGTIELESEINCGSTFTVNLPIVELETN